MNSTPLESLTQAKFAECLNTGFQVWINSTETMELRLAEVTSGLMAASNGQRGGQFESFSLMFHGPNSRFLPQKTYTFEHPRLGKFELFIVPVGRDGDLFKYQAVFNRRIQSA
ncbi:MAG TPA: hypothetical protein VG754_09565 [Verrucomicrobiae bacterium]|jgi:hypothetical protein|nr:hypothetical protein [Verrucomicrobiae bacterium]